MGRRKKQTGMSYVSIVTSTYVGHDAYDRAQRDWSESIEKPRSVSSKPGRPLPELLPEAEDCIDDLEDDLS